MKQKEKLLVIIDNWETSFHYSNKLLFNNEFDVDFLQIVTKENTQDFPLDVNIIKHGCLWNNNFNKLINHISSYFKIVNFIKKKDYKLICIYAMPSPHDSLLFLYKVLCSKKYKFYIGLCTPLGNSHILKAIFRLNLKLFKYIGGDTPLLRKELGLEKRKLLRGDMGYSSKYGYKDRDFTYMRLVYIGVMGIRRIDKTIDGLAIFIKNNPNVKCTYDIIGGDKNSIDIINEKIIKYKLDKVVRCHGFLSLKDVQCVFDKVNVGVSFVPKIKIYDGVSVTKTVEYLLCGMPVIGTSVSFNSNLLDETSGCLCEDTPDSFAAALEKIYLNMSQYSSSKIRNKYEHLASDNVVKNKFIPDLKKIINNE